MTLLATRAQGLLRTFNELGVLEAADVHVASRLGRLGGEADERVLLAAALAVRGTRQGSVVLRLADVPRTVTVETEEPLPWPDADAWATAVAGSALVGTGPEAGRPLHWQDGGLWLDRSWRQEVAVADALLTRAVDLPDVDDARLGEVLGDLWPGTAPDDQRLAAAVCVLSRTAVLVGGPGTGKTTTVARVLTALREVSERPPRVALAAPTGKAASRLQESVQQAGATLKDPWLTGLTATTLHRLLGMRRGTTRPWHTADNRLPHDLVVVDEASMVSLGLFARLLDALRPGARLLLVGDPDQLASVEAGAVLADLVAAAAGARVPLLRERLAAVVPDDPPGPEEPDTPSARVRSGVARLETVHRFDQGGAIDDLAAAVRAGDPDAVLEVLRRGDPAVVFDEVPDDIALSGQVLAAVRADVLAQSAALAEAARAGKDTAALQALDRHRLLCAHREGPRGVALWTRTVQRWVVDALGVQPRADGRYAGLPLLVTANDPDNKLYNGDSGVVVARGDDLVAVFGRGDGPYEVPLGRLADVRPLHVMTVHRSQGSQFDRVTVLLPSPSSPLGTRETFYTAVTRAAAGVRVVGSEEGVRAAVLRPVARATGLRQRLA